MKIDTEKFRVRAGHNVSLERWPTRTAPVYTSKDQYHNILTDHIEQLSAQQNLLYADNRFAVLVIFQAMDAAGKDGAIKHVMSGVNPQGCQVYSFKHPSAAELQHDFLAHHPQFAGAWAYWHFQSFLLRRGADPARAS